MKYFFNEEAALMDAITDNLEMHVLTKANRGYILAPNDKAREIVRGILSSIYRQGFDEAVRQIKKKVDVPIP